MSRSTVFKFLALLLAVAGLWLCSQEPGPERSRPRTSHAGEASIVLIMPREDRPSRRTPSNCQQELLGLRRANQRLESRLTKASALLSELAHESRGGEPSRSLAALAELLTEAGTRQQAAADQLRTLVVVDAALLRDSLQRQAEGLRTLAAVMADFTAALEARDERHRIAFIETTRRLEDGLDVVSWPGPGRPGS